MSAPLPGYGVRFEGHCAGCGTYPAVLEKVREDVYRCDACRRAEQHAGQAGPWPHPGGCGGCRDAHVCNVCGGPITRATRCTNGRCPQCHAAVCTPGGEVAPGHGYGSPSVAAAYLARRRVAS